MIMPDEDFRVRLEAIEHHFSANDAERPAPEVFAAGYHDLDQLTTDPGNLADRSRIDQLRMAVLSLYRQARDWEVEVPHGWSQTQAQRLGVPLAVEFNLAEDAFSARLAQARVDTGGPGPGQEEFDRAFQALEELATDPAVEADTQRDALVGAAAKVLYRQAVNYGIRLPEGWR
jgi:hypothetical protein